LSICEKKNFKLRKFLDLHVVNCVVLFFFEIFIFIFSCFALKDLLTQVAEGDTISHLLDVWKVLFKVLDDVKESVRKAATSLSMTVIQV